MVFPVGGFVGIIVALSSLGGDISPPTYSGVRYPRVLGPSPHSRVFAGEYLNVVVLAPLEAPLVLLQER